MEPCLGRTRRKLRPRMIRKRSRVEGRRSPRSWRETPTEHRQCEQTALARVDGSSPPNVVDETRKRLRGVRGIEEQSLRPGRKSQGSHGRFGERAVPNPDVGVIIADLGRVKREIQLEERCRSHRDLGDHRRLIGNERARGDADQAIRERKDLPCQREASLSRCAGAEVRDIGSPAERLELFLQLEGRLDVPSAARATEWVSHPSVLMT